MAQAEKIEIPDELSVLNPEFQKKPIVVGTDAYMIYPLTEGQAERVSQLLSDVLSEITTMDIKCPNCEHVFQGMLGKQETCNRCSSGKKNGKKSVGGHQLVSMQKTPVAALTHKDRIPVLIEEVVGIPKDEVKEALTINQFKHIAGVLYEQNFNEEITSLPEKSRKNFKALLGWIGLAAQDPEEQTKKDIAADLEKSMKPLPMNMGSQENISKVDGKKEGAQAQEEVAVGRSL